MLKPYKQIGIFYGRRHDERDFAEAEIARLRKEGFRVIARRLDIKESDLKDRKVVVYEQLKRQMQEIDAALIFMTGDDLAVLVAAAAGEPQRKQARPNVLMELGQITERLDATRFRLFGPKDLSVPSNIDKHEDFVIHALDHHVVREQLLELLTKSLGLRRQPPALVDAGYVLEYGDMLATRGGRHLGHKDSVVGFLEAEFGQLELAGDRLIYLFERIVFDSYFNDPQWWQRLLRTLPGKRTASAARDEGAADYARLKLGKAILVEVMKYMNAWQPPDVTDHAAIQHVAARLESLLGQAQALQPLNPVILEVGYDYLGLALHKLGTRSADAGEAPATSPKERDALVERACAALQRVVELAEKYDDPRLPLWLGYSTFNLARCLHALVASRKRMGRAHVALLRRADALFAKAIEVRTRWTTCGYELPLHIQEGLEIEMLHAKVQRLHHAELVNGQSPRSRRVAGSKEVERLKKEYVAWVAGARMRLRLAMNVHNAWAGIDDRMEKLRGPATN